MTSLRKNKITNLLKGIETGDAESVRVVNEGRYIQHNPRILDGLPVLRLALRAVNDNISSMEYSRNHRVLAEGCFVLSVCEGIDSGIQPAFYDLYRVADGRLVEHWNTIEAVRRDGAAPQFRRVIGAAK